MRVAITGAGGNLGRFAAPELTAAGHSVRLVDIRPLDTPHESVVADVRDRDALLSALEGCDAVVHAAALHGIHLGNWSPADFWDLNATGTLNVYETARALAIRKIVLCSTMGVYGAALEKRPDAWGLAHEGLPLQPTDVYGLTKVVAEETARTYARQDAVETVALRFGMFVPEKEFARYGFRLLFGGVDDRDVAQSVALALAHQPEGGFEAFDIMADTPFTETDLGDLHTDFAGTLEKAYPGTNALLAERGLDPNALVWWPVLWPVDRAKARLGYRPRYSFAEFLTALKADDLTHYPVLGLPWWGV